MSSVLFNCIIVVIPAFRMMKSRQTSVIFHSAVVQVMPRYLHVIYCEFRLTVQTLVPVPCTAQTPCCVSGSLLSKNKCSGLELFFCSLKFPLKHNLLAVWQIQQRAQAVCFQISDQTHKHHG